ncbi:MAG: hypothetical protein KKH98_14260 [Spirochaetes bacterium]|nr:hypothetical protein [Spirochaetota bacterium]
MIVLVILNACSTIPEVKKSPNKFITVITNSDSLSDSDIIAIHEELVECDLLKKDYSMVLEENELLKLRVKYLEENEPAWYDNSTVGFILGIGTAILCVWGAGQLR